MYWKDWPYVNVARIGFEWCSICIRSNHNFLIRLFNSIRRWHILSYLLNFDLILFFFWFYFFYWLYSSLPSSWTLNLLFATDPVLHFATLFISPFRFVLFCPKRRRPSWWSLKTKITSSSASLSHSQTRMSLLSLSLSHTHTHTHTHKHTSVTGWVDCFSILGHLGTTKKNSPIA